MQPTTGLKQHKPAPILPYGNPTTWQGIAENFAFHASPEDFIAKRVLAFQQSRPDLASRRVPIRARILNRNVAILSSHAQILQILRDPDGSEPDTSYETNATVSHGETDASASHDGYPRSSKKDDNAHFAACPAYEKLMGSFFPSPNLLLTDGTPHAYMRRAWERKVADLPQRLSAFVDRSTRAHFSRVLDKQDETNLYENMKVLAWRILLGAMLGLGEDEPEFREIEELQETLLRGQFSLFPVSLDTGFWQSPRKRGINAKQRLQAMIKKRLEKQEDSGCPFMPQVGSAGDTVASVDVQETADHVLLFTSSLAVKALASLLTAVFLNLYLHPGNDGIQGLVPQVCSRSSQDPNEDEASKMLTSLVNETLRLSPPIVGVMRQAMRDHVLLDAADDYADILIPRGWDVWLYFVGGSRDPDAFGADSDMFQADRYLDQSTPTGFAFGAGAKTCLGRPWMTHVVSQVAKSVLAMQIDMAGVVSLEGVRAWLGWRDSRDINPEIWARDMKQLPTQHPVEPILVKFSKTEST